MEDGLARNVENPQSRAIRFTGQGIFEGRLGRGGVREAVDKYLRLTSGDGELLGEGSGQPVIIGDGQFHRVAALCSILVFGILLRRAIPVAEVPAPGLNLSIWIVRLIGESN